MTNTQVSKLTLANKEISKLKLYTIDREGYYLCKSEDGFMHVIKNGIDLLEGKKATKVIWGGVDLEGVDLRLVCENYRNPADCIYKQEDGFYYTLENHVKLGVGDIMSHKLMQPVEIGSGFDYIPIQRKKAKNLKEIIKKRSFVNFKTTIVHQTLSHIEENKKSFDD